MTRYRFSKKQKTSWSMLPNEVQAMIVQKLDFQTSCNLRNCGTHEANLTKQFAKKKNVEIRVHLCGRSSEIKWFVDVFDKEDAEFRSVWWVWELPNNSSKIHYQRAPRKKRIKGNIENKSTTAAVSGILRRLLTEPFFVVKNLEFKFRDFQDKLDFGPVEVCVDRLTFTKCSHQLAIREIFFNKNLKFRGIYGTEDQDRTYLYMARALFYEPIVLSHPHLYAICLNYHYDFCITNFRFEVFDFALTRVQIYLSHILLFDEMRKREAVRYKIQSKETIDTFMYFRAAYCDQFADPVPYLRTTDADYDSKVAFLKSGVDTFYLNDHQIATLSAFYLVRLLQDEPECCAFERTIRECLRLMLEEYEEVNYYEKLVAKVETLLQKTETVQ